MIDHYVSIKDDPYYCISLRESIPNVLSAISYVNTDKKIQIEVVFGKMGVLNNGIVAPTLYLVNTEGEIEVKNEKEQFEYIFNSEKVETEKTDQIRLVSLHEHLIKEIAEKTRAFEQKFGTCSVEWWIWKDRVYAADMSVLSNAVDTKAGRVISSGHTKGFLHQLPELNEKTMEDINMFSAISVSDTEFDVNQVDVFRKISEQINEWKKDGSVILYSELPYIYLTPFVKMVDGFVFKDASSLCHLSLIIREAKIPAISLLGTNVMDMLGKEIILNAVEGVVELE